MYLWIFYVGYQTIEVRVFFFKLIFQRLVSVFIDFLRWLSDY